MLANLYKKENFVIRYDVPGDDIYHRGDPYDVEMKESYANPLHDSTKAKHWERVAEHLQGKTTPHEREKFLTGFLYSQDGTPGGLYNIGYALFHNEHIGDKAKALDYLKHAANLGDANAARELGEIFHDRFEAANDQGDLQHAHFWYAVAADLGHPNGKARAEYLEKAFPEVTQAALDDKVARNPSQAHVRQYPASAWYVDVPLTDVSNLLKDTTRGGLVKRLEYAVGAIDEHVAEFENVAGILQARVEELAHRQVLLDDGVDADKAKEISALRHNDGLSEKQRASERAISTTKNRWIQETAKNMGSTLLLTPFAGGSHMILSNSARATGYHGVMNNEIAHHQAIINELEGRKIDTSRFGDEIHELTLEVQRLIDSGPIQSILKDEIRSRALVEGYLRQRILKSGLDNCRLLDEKAKEHGMESVDAVLEAFQQSNPQLGEALLNLCQGHANSKDMAIILADVNALRGDALAPHEQSVKKFVELVMKENIAHYMTRASQIDVIQELNLVNFETMNVNHKASSQDIVAVASEPAAEAMGRQQVDAATRLAMTCMFSNQFGVTHIGQYDVTRMFSFYLHRHGSSELIADELHDGKVSDEMHAKRVSLKSDDEMDGFVKRAKRSAERGREDLPEIGDLFLRTCVYEYYLPQAVISSGRGNRFKDNPEAPVAYPMVNNVIQDFIGRMSLTDIAQYREQIGPELDNVIAQTFLDFFQEVGKKHSDKYAEDRAWVQDAFAHGNYGPRFSGHQGKITRDVQQEFPLFIKLYERNLEKSMEVLPEDRAGLLREQINELHADAKDYLNPAVLQPGSHQSRQAARERDHRGANMTERWNFG